MNRCRAVVVAFRLVRLFILSLPIILATGCDTENNAPELKDLSISIDVRQIEKKIVSHKESGSTKAVTEQFGRGDSFREDDSPQKNGLIKIKGLYVGMDINDAQTVLKRLLVGIVEDVTVSKRRDGFEIHHIEHLNLEEVMGSALAAAFVVGRVEKEKVAEIRVRADENRKVTAIYLSGALVDKLFDAENIDTRDFVDQFCKAYEIPRMDRRYDDDYDDYWVHMGFKGLKVVIQENKGFMLEKVKQLGRLDFN